MKDILIIHPNDPSTSFLLEAFNYLLGIKPEVDLIKVEPNEASHEACIDQIKNHQTIIFMGHGSHQKLSGAASETFKSESLISYSEILSQPKRNWILFSCNSNDLIKKCSSNIGFGIGFGNMPTDFNDISGIREFAANSYDGISETDIFEFRKSINSIIINSVIRFIDCENPVDTYNFIRILITQKYIQLLASSSNKKDVAMHSNLLFEMKEDILIINNLDG